MKKRSITSIAIALSVFGLAAPAEAQDLVPASPYQIAQTSPCSGSSNIEILRCLRLRYETADRRLNQVYRQVSATLQPPQKQILTDAQLAWIEFRDKSCDFETYGNRGGSGYSGFLNGCLERVTRARTAELEAYLQRR